MGPTSKGRKGIDGNEGNGRMSERGEGQGKGEGEWKGRGRKERGTDLPDQCHTASYTPDLFFCNLQSYIRNIKMSEFGTRNKIHYYTKINTIRQLNEISTDIFLHFHLKTQYGTFFSNRKGLCYHYVICKNIIFIMQSIFRPMRRNYSFVAAVG